MQTDGKGTAAVDRDNEEKSLGFVVVRRRSDKRARSTHYVQMFAPSLFTSVPTARPAATAEPGIAIHIEMTFNLGCEGDGGAVTGARTRSSRDGQRLAAVVSRSGSSSGSANTITNTGKKKAGRGTRTSRRSLLLIKDPCN